MHIALKARGVLLALVTLLAPAAAPAQEVPAPEATATPVPGAEPELPAAAPSPAPRDLELAVEVQGAALRSSSLHLLVTVAGNEGGPEAAVDFLAGDRLLERRNLAAGSHEIHLENAALGAGAHTLTVRSGTAEAVSEATTEISTLPAWISVIPPLVAILLALVFRDVLVALFSGVFVGALALTGWSPFSALGRSVDTFVTSALADSDHAKILVFSTLLGGMVGIMSKSGGTRGIVERLKPLATSPRRGQLATWCMGILVFFDDYANSLIVGSTMRPITDRLKISREKLAYIVDSTAAPIASIVPISTWIGFEVGLMGGAFTQLGLPYDPYATFVASIPYRFYPILALVLGLTLAVSGRDIGPMLAAERRARTTGKVLGDGHQPLADYGSDALEPPPGTTFRAVNALLPIVTVILVTLFGLYLTGSSGLTRGDYGGTGAWLREVFGNSNSYDVLLWASLSGVLVAVILPLVQRILSIAQAMSGLVEGFKAMLLALVVLVLAWSIGDVCAQLHTADFLVGLTSGVLSPHFLPVLVFVIAAVVAFATGTSWATMSILIPLVIPILHGLAAENGITPGTETYFTLLAGTVSSVLAGAVWGDHCSPISDTTILSSTGAGCDHIAHVKTQLPYALGIGVLGMILGDLPTAFGLSPWISILVATVVIVVGVRWLGRRPVEAEP